MHDATTIPHCTFRVGDQCLAVESAAVAEVLGARTVTPVPLAPPGVAGIVHLRGRIVPVVDPAVRLGLPVSGDRASGDLLVLRGTGDAWCGLLVDEVLDVVEIPPAAVERPTATGEDPLLGGVFAAPGRLVHVLDFQRMIQPTPRPRPQAS